MSLREVDHGKYKVSEPMRLVRVARINRLTVWSRRNRPKGERPYVVGFVRDGKRILLEDFSLIADARRWATSNAA